MKTPGAENRRRTADVFPTSLYCISPHPEAIGILYLGQDKRKAKDFRDRQTACEGVFKHRMRNKEHSS